MIICPVSGGRGGLGDWEKSVRLFGHCGGREKGSKSVFNARTRAPSLSKKLHDQKIGGKFFNDH